MAKIGEFDKTVFWWTAIIVTIIGTLIDKLFDVIHRSLNDAAFLSIKGYFSSSQPDYFPLIYLIIVFLATLLVVRIYLVLLPQMPSSWIARGFLVGGFIFIVADLANLIQAGYTTQLPGSVARGMAIAGLGSSLANGCLLAYVHMRLSGAKKRKR